MFKPYIFVLCLIFYFNHSLTAQELNAKIYGMTANEIKINVTNPMHDLSWGDLYSRFSNEDSLKPQEMAMLYYGYVFMPEYDPMILLVYETQMLLMNDSMQYKKAKLAGDTLLDKFPVSVLGNHEMSFCLGKLNEKAQAQYHLRLYYRVLKTILGTGDGLKPKSAYIVLSYKDVYIITQVNQMLLLKQKNVYKKKQHYVVATVYHKNTKKKIWFNTTLIEKYGKK
jgi:hypothetical protein